MLLRCPPRANPNSRVSLGRDTFVLPKSMLAVILAAGDGGRLREQTADVPKALVSIAGRPLISYTLDSLTDAGIDDALIVVGHREEQMRSALSDGGVRLPRISFVPNPRFGGGASLSLRAARRAVGEQHFLLLMSDHLLSAPIIRTLASNWREGGPSLLATDASEWPASYSSEATKVRFVAGSREVAEIGKNLPAWDALDTGAFLVGPEAWAVVDAAPEDCELSVIFGELARRGALRGVDVSGAAWYDVDTVEDLEAASRMVEGGGR
jgi:choline kinase